MMCNLLVSETLTNSNPPQKKNMFISKTFFSVLTQFSSKIIMLRNLIYPGSVLESKLFSILEYGFLFTVNLVRMYHPTTVHTRFA